MTCRIQPVGDANWRFCPDDPPPAAARTQCVALAHIVDDLTLAPPLAPMIVGANRPEFAGRNGPGGLVGAIGQPFPDLPPAQVAGTGIALTIAAPGYAPLTLTGALAAQPGYPASFTPLDLGTWRLARVQVTIAGRVTRLVGGAPVPIAGASVAVTAATPAPSLAGAQPSPPSAASFLALAAVSDAAGTYRLGPVARALRLTLTASQGGGSQAVEIDLDYAEPFNLLDFVLP